MIARHHCCLPVTGSGSATAEECFPEFNTPPGCTSVNASPRQLPADAHHSRPRRLARSYLVRLFHSLLSPGLCRRTPSRLVCPQRSTTCSLSGSYYKTFLIELSRPSPCKEPPTNSKARLTNIDYGSGSFRVSRLMAACRSQSITAPSDPAVAKTDSSAEIAIAPICGTYAGMPLRIASDGSDLICTSSLAPTSAINAADGETALNAYGFQFFGGASRYSEPSAVR